MEKQVGGFVRLVFAKLLHIGGSSNDIEGKKEADAGLSLHSSEECFRYAASYSAIPDV